MNASLPLASFYSITSLELAIATDGLVKPTAVIKNVSRYSCWACITDVGFIPVLCCAPGFDSTKFHTFDIFFVLRLRGMKDETDITSHRLMKINAGYDVRKITVSEI